MSKKTAEQIAAEKARIVAEEKKIIAEAALEKASDALSVARERFLVAQNQATLTCLRDAGAELAVAKAALYLAREEFEKTRQRRPRKTVAVGAQQ